MDPLALAGAKANGLLINDGGSSQTSGQRAVWHSFQRHVQSQPTLVTRDGRQTQSSNRMSSGERGVTADAGLANVRMNLAGVGSLLGINERGGDDSHRQVGFSSPAYRIIADSYQ